MKILKLIIFLMISICVVGCQATFEDGYELADIAKKNINEISTDSLIKKIERYDPYSLIDIRQAAEFAEDNIPGSILIPRGELEFKILNDKFWEEEFLYTPLKTDEIIVYCNGGNRGALAAETLQKLGFSNVYSLSGGFKAYTQAVQTSEVE